MKHPSVGRADLFGEEGAPEDFLWSQPVVCYSKGIYM